MTDKNIDTFYVYEKTEGGLFIIKAIYTVKN